MRSGFASGQGLEHEVYGGTKPERRNTPLRCECNGRCEPEGVEPGLLTHGKRCSKWLNSYGKKPTYGVVLCSPCMRRMLDVGVDIPRLLPPSSLDEPAEKIVLPNLYKWRKKRRVGVANLSDKSGVPMSRIMETEAGEEIERDAACSLAYALRVRLERLADSEVGRGGKAPGAVLKGLLRELQAAEVAPRQLAEDAGLRDRDHVYKLYAGLRKASPEQVEAIAKVLGCEEKDLLR